MKKLKFIDLFAGLGGFHLGLQRLGHKCVYACEINPHLNELYKKTHTFCLTLQKVCLSKHFFQCFVSMICF